MSTNQQPLDPKDENPATDTSEQLESNEPLGAEGADHDLAALLEAAQAQVAQYHDELLRAKAEVENIRRRAQDDVAKARKFGTESFAESLVPVKDSLEAALALPDQTPDAWRAGVEATLKQLVSAFERNLMKDVAPVPGDKFDPNVHQAISSIPSDFPEGSIVQTLQKGYTIADRVLRPALVTVSSGK
ncbi:MULTISPECIES: nucleotide exchange factor GrpE [unclassified Pusillimonas]|uniref:nucleotide exchange factor GrpE n=1 Tax=unclassified Pusillimonas TaxID=2640016 RepID=UPI000B9C86A0|nr:MULTISPECIES: nucleotide exchange factor GrpE [unclassified Pusillimonas]OXR50537.1 nucleotide exchange factor GrpE [Pusillimonas sp. T2]ROT45541.1 nucleotide exchange factor GrpE [Pusillimonas sp. NJUB218]